MTRPPAVFSAAPEQVWSVAALTDAIKDLLEGTFPSVWVSGEISNFSRPQSGHCYLTLKDDLAQMRAVIWARSPAAMSPLELHDGLEVICRGSLDVYAPRGSYQLVIKEIQPKGMGALELALRRLREKLAAEGLFELERKRPVPSFPRKIAFVTSPTGAAIRDFLEALRKRWVGIHVLVVPVRVQGDGAAQEIAAAIVRINRFTPPPDVLVVGRGGGSLEDLWAFNEEVVVRAIYASSVPVVSAIGHETDCTLSDLVADVRALTPTDAATRVVPSADEVRKGLESGERRLAGALLRRMQLGRAQLEALAARRVLRRPFQRIYDVIRRLDELQLRGERAVRRHLFESRRRWDAASGRLDALSPLAVLERGYTITERESDGLLVLDASKVASGERLRTRFARGKTVSRVEEVSDE